MKTSTLNVQNIKCGGCGNSITTALNKIIGISNAKVDVEQEHVSFDYEDVTYIEAVILRLEKMGYPLAESDNTFGDKAKSYISCMIGRLSSKENESTESIEK